MSAHVVKKSGDLDFGAVGGFDGRSSGYAADAVVHEDNGGVQMGFNLAVLQPGGHVDAHVHSYEESVFVTDGALR